MRRMRRVLLFLGFDCLSGINDDASFVSWIWIRISCWWMHPNKHLNDAVLKYTSLLKSQFWFRKKKQWFASWSYYSQKENQTSFKAKSGTSKWNLVEDHELLEDQRSFEKFQSCLQAFQLPNSRFKWHQICWCGERVEWQRKLPKCCEGTETFKILKRH